MLQTELIVTKLNKKLFFQYNPKIKLTPIIIHFEISNIKYINIKKIRFKK